MSNKRITFLFAAAGALVGIGWAQAQRQNANGGRAGARPPAVRRLSVRLEPWANFRTVAPGIIGWQIGVPTDAFPHLTFAEALAKADALGVAYVEGFSTQEFSREIPKKLDDNLAPGEIAAVIDALRAYNLQMPVYFTPSISADENLARKLFVFAKALGVETIVSGATPESLAAVDTLAKEYGVNVAIEGVRPEDLLKAVEGCSPRVGVYADTANWVKEGIKPVDAVGQLKDRLLVINLKDRSAQPLSQLLPEIYRLGLKPSLLIDTTSSADSFTDLALLMEEFDKAFQPVLGARVDQISRETPNWRIDSSMSPEEKQKMETREATDLSRYGVTPDEERQRMDAALPRQAPAQPKKPRKLLVIDLCVGYNGHIASRFWVDYALELLGQRTGAYEAVFSNDLDNLKYPKIKQYDAVYLNNTVGQLFVDQEVRDGLSRFVREGGGLGGDHGTSHASMDWAEFGEMLGAYHGIHRENTEQAMVRIDDPNSPLTAAFQGKEFLYKDEFFRFPTPPYSREKLHVLLSMDVAKTDMNQGTPCSQPCARADNDYATAWIRSYDKGRVFYCALGHQPTLFTTPSLANFMLAGIQFILGDLPADTTPSAQLAASK